jgi:DNA-binding GntR family transcriptional regulator
MNVIGVVQSVVEALRDLIITGELVAGQKLNEISLSAQFNVSRPPLREAFRTLENDLLIVSVPRKGCYVSQTSIEDLRMLFEARIMVESYSVDMLKQKNIKKIPGIVAGLMNEEANPAPWETLNKKEKLKCLNNLAEFHAKLVESTENSILIKFREKLVYNFARYQYKYPYSEESLAKSRYFHDLIRKHIEGGAYETAKLILHDHHRTFVERLEAKMREEEK